ncbi:MAG: hypothetical protein Q9182_001398 [Xanthomendoza sp. 2 TL-2023]
MDVEKGMDIEPPSPHTTYPRFQSWKSRGQSQETAEALTKPPPLSARAQALLQASKAETGFDSYHAYIEFHAKEHPRLARLGEELVKFNGRVDGPFLPEFRPKRRSKESKWAGSILNVLESDISLEHSDKYGTQLIETLCHPPEEARLQIVLWNLSFLEDSPCQTDLLSFLGMYFRLDPVYFEALVDRVNNFHLPFNRNMNTINRHDPTLIEAGPFVATVCRQKDQPHGVSVILIAGSLEREPSLTEPSLKFDLHDYICPYPPLFASSGPERQQEISQCPGYYQYYPRVLKLWLDRHPDAKRDDTSLIILCFLPLLQLNHDSLRRHSHEVYKGIGAPNCIKDTVTLDPIATDQIWANDLYELRTSLRDHINATENNWYRFMRYVRFHLNCEPTKLPFYPRILDDYTNATSEGTRLENHGRDYLQLQAGALGLEESRKSIELADRQMEEAKRGKLLQLQRNVKLTILAFVYVPLNLATSIYGMNLQQLFQTGQSVKAFVITALIALVITGAAWLTTEGVNNYSAWTRRRSSSPVPTFNIAQRLAMITWLVLNRHGRWMMRTGAWWRILLNSGEVFHGKKYRGKQFRLPVGEFVMGHILRKRYVKLNEFHPSPPPMQQNSHSLTNKLPSYKRNKRNHDEKVAQSLTYHPVSHILHNYPQTATVQSTPLPSDQDLNHLASTEPNVRNAPLIRPQQ